MFNKAKLIKEQNKQIEQAQKEFVNLLQDRNYVFGEMVELKEQLAKVQAELVTKEVMNEQLRNQILEITEQKKRDTIPDITPAVPVHEGGLESSIPNAHERDLNRERPPLRISRNPRPPVVTGRVGDLPIKPTEATKGKKI